MNTVLLRLRCKDQNYIITNANKFSHRTSFPKINSRMLLKSDHLISKIFLYYLLQQPFIYRF